MELLTYLEADPFTDSYAEFDFSGVLPPNRASELNQLAAYRLNHHIGRFVVCAEPEHADVSPAFHSAWVDADRILAKHEIWLLAFKPRLMRKDPYWHNMCKIARCAQTEVAHGDLMRVIAFLEDVEQAAFRDCMKLCLASRDSFDAVLKMISAGLLSFDQDARLSLASILKLRSVMPISGSTLPWARALAEQAAWISDGAPYA
jgi:hypothetical protein